MNKIIFVITYVLLGIIAGRSAYKNSTPEEKVGRAYRVGIVIGSCLWPLAIILYIIIGIINAFIRKIKQR